MTSAILWICTAIALVVFGIMLYSVATFRYVPPASGVARNHSTIAEILWTLIPIAIFVGAVTPALKMLEGSVG